jgi:hypothetical protein
MDKARLRLWLLRNASRAWLVRILYQVNPRLACSPDPVSILRGGAFPFQSLELECPPLHKLLRLPARYRIRRNSSRHGIFRCVVPQSGSPIAFLWPRARRTCGIKSRRIARAARKVAKRVVTIPNFARIGLRRRVQFKLLRRSCSAYTEYPIGEPESGLICRISHEVRRVHRAPFAEIATRIMRRRAMLQRGIVVPALYSECTGLRISRIVGSDPPIILYRQWWHSG